MFIVRIQEKKDWVMFDGIGPENNWILVGGKRKK